MHGTIFLADAAATAAFGAAIAARLRPGDTVLLEGPLGAGKSAVCRAALRALTGDPELDVPSPTYTLVQSYATPLGPVHHYDLWRLGDPEALEELGFFDAAGGVRLVEWAGRLADWGVAPDGRVWTVALGFEGAGRQARVIAP